MSLLSLLVTTCGLALFSVSLFVSWKLCWVPLSGRFLPDVLKGAHFLGGDQQPVLTEVRRKSRVNYLYEQHLVLMGISCKQKGAVYFTVYRILFFEFASIEFHSTDADRKPGVTRGYHMQPTSYSAKIQPGCYSDMVCIFDNQILQKSPGKIVFHFVLLPLFCM